MVGGVSRLRSKRTGFVEQGLIATPFVSSAVEKPFSPDFRARRLDSGRIARHL
jgi:hypothetical protein